MNDKIETLRGVALSTLKPSKRDLDYGMGLHREALVCDAYSFSPNGAPDAGRLVKELEQGIPLGEVEFRRHGRSTLGPLENEEERAEVADVWREAGVNCLVQNAGGAGPDLSRILRRLAHFAHLTDRAPDLVRKGVSPDDIEEAARQGIPCLYFSANGVPLAQEWQNTEAERRFIRVFFQLGTRIMHLTYNRANMIGAGCGEAVDAGLTDFGQSVVKEMNRAGVIVDVAHSGWQTSLDAAGTSSVPMVASHSAFCGLYEHYRGKPDEVVRAIADTGGYVGVCCIPKFLGGTFDIAALVDHLEYGARTFGADHVAIGTDMGYSTRRYDAEIRRYLDVKEKLPNSSFDGLWPPHEAASQPVSPEEMQRRKDSLAWTNWPLFTVGLVQRGLPDEDIRKIIGKNVLRVARDAWNAREPLE